MYIEQHTIIERRKISSLSEGKKSFNLVGFFFLHVVCVADSALTLF